MARFNCGRKRCAESNYTKISTSHPSIRNVCGEKGIISTFAVIINGLGSQLFRECELRSWRLATLQNWWDLGEFMKKNHWPKLFRWVMFWLRLPSSARKASDNLFTFYAIKSNKESRAEITLNFIVCIVAGKLSSSCLEKERNEASKGNNGECFAKQREKLLFYFYSALERRKDCNKIL